MRIAQDWTDYSIVATGDGYKLERWKDVYLLRPDPQAIWHAQTDMFSYPLLNAYYKRSEKGGGGWTILRPFPSEWNVSYEKLGLTFKIKPMGFKHTGLFPEQAVNWEKAYELIAKRKAEGREVKVLNLFAYTGGATLAAAAAGAQVTHVDASKGMVQWAKENAEASHLKDAPIRWLVDDCMKFVEREIRRGNTYDAIIMDPPSYGRGPKGEIWKIEDSVYPLVQQAAKLLTEDSIFFLINSYTTGLQPAVMSYMLGTAIRARLGGVIHSEEVGLPVTETGLVLPCGCSGRWESCEKS